MRHAGSQIRSRKIYELYPTEPFYRARLQAMSGTENYPARYFLCHIASIYIVRRRRSLPLITWHGLHNAWRVAVW